MLHGSVIGSLDLFGCANRKNPAVADNRNSIGNSKRQVAIM
jgi:hypothetical protein